MSRPVPSHVVRDYLLIAALRIVLASTVTVVTISPNGDAKTDVDPLEEHYSAAFTSFLQTYHRSYESGSDEYSKRRALFTRRMTDIEALNKNPHRSWTASINGFADRTDAELRSFRGWKSTGENEMEDPPSFLEIERRTYPVDFNWLNLTRAKAIPDQGSCGSCWAITTAAVMDAHHEIWRNQVKTFSAQELVACVPNPNKCGGSGGCDGATVELGMKWIMSNSLSTEAQVPYVGEDSSCAKTDLARMKNADGSVADSHNGMSLGLTGWHTLPRNKEAALLDALVDRGPVAVSVAAGSWFSYSTGIFNGCGKDVVVDHAVTLYGIGKEAKQNYWLIRNSWGLSWGEEGFIRIARSDHEDKVCGTDNEPQKGVGCKGGPSQVTVCGTCGILFDSVVPHFEGVGVALVSDKKLPTDAAQMFTETVDDAAKMVRREHDRDHGRSHRRHHENNAAATRIHRRVHHGGDIDES